MLILFIAAVALFAVVAYFARKSSQPSPILKIKDGAHQAVAAAKNVADVNNDGKVTVADAIEVVQNVKAEAKRAVKNFKAETARAKRKYGGKVKKKKAE
jgi:methyl-accepting chemotaxis protein